MLALPSAYTGTHMEEWLKCVIQFSFGLRQAGPSRTGSVVAAAEEEEEEEGSELKTAMKRSHLVL